MRPGGHYTLRTTEFEHIDLCVTSAEAKFNNSLAGDEAAVTQAISAIFRTLRLLAETLAEQESA
jgi:hypothetical protein